MILNERCIIEIKSTYGFSKKSHKSVHEPLYWDSQMESINIGEKFVIYI